MGLTSFSYHLLILHQILLIKSLVSQYETSSNSSQFLDLENLIGSFHTYAPNHTDLIVRNLGFTDGQQKLLKRYEHIQIVSPTHTPSKGSQSIDVDHEFILLNNTLSHRHNQGKYFFLDAIRKQFSLAIVIPFIESQFNQVIHQLDLTQLYPPCRKRSSYPVDLIFYHNEKTSTFFEKNISQFSQHNECYQHIYHLTANLSEEENIYPIGSAYMWKKLFIDEQVNSVALRARGYTHFFLMEPDTRPIRSYWLDVLVEKMTNGHDPRSYMTTHWWMMGSIYRGTIPMAYNFLHINGNALYHLSLDFIRFIENVSKEIPYVLGKTKGYDLDLFLYLFNHHDIAKDVWHKFQFTDSIQNCWHTGCNDTDSEFMHTHPNTYLVHGHVVLPKRVSLLKKCFYFVLIGLILFIFRRFRHHRRRFSCKRNLLMDYSDVCRRKLSSR